MKTIILKDIIKAIATPDKLAALHSALTPMQYFDLMMNTGSSDNAEDIGVLSTGHTDAATYLQALVEHIGKTKKFWTNANKLIVEINKGISIGNRKRFHIEERTISPKLITMLEKEVPETSEALNYVTEENLDTGDLLSMYLCGKADEANGKVTVKLQFPDKEVVSSIRLNVRPFGLRFQTFDHFILQILKEFRNNGTKKITFGKEVLDMYIEPNAYFGFAEGDVCATFLQMTIDGDNDSKLGLGLPVFSNVDATRTDETVENQTPESMTITINEDAWLTLTLPCTLVQ